MLQCMSPEYAHKSEADDRRDNRGKCHSSVQTHGLHIVSHYFLRFLTVALPLELHTEF